MIDDLCTRCHVRRADDDTPEVALGIEATCWACLTPGEAVTVLVYRSEDNAGVIHRALEAGREMPEIEAEALAVLDELAELRQRRAA